MKNDSIVRKQMMLYMATIAIFVAVVCGALTIFYTKHYMAEKRENWFNGRKNRTGLQEGIPDRQSERAKL